MIGSRWPERGRHCPAPDTIGQRSGNNLHHEHEDGGHFSLSEDEDDANKLPAPDAVPTTTRRPVGCAHYDTLHQIRLGEALRYIAIRTA